MILSIPIVFATVTLLMSTNMILNIFDAIVIAIGSYVIFPISARFFSLSKRPRPYICSVIAWGQFDKTDESCASKENFIIESRKREILIDRRERYLSSYFSIILIAWIIYIVICPVYIFLNGTEPLLPIYNGIKEISYHNMFLLGLMFLGLPLLYAFMGELFLYIANVEDILKMKR